jgi:lipopolysaccharide export system protein LptC
MSLDPSRNDDDFPFSELSPLAPAIGRAASQPVSFPVRLWGLLVTAVPLLILMMLALFTWWLVQNAPQALSPSQRKPLTHDPDFEMKRFSMRDFDDQGTQRALIKGDLLRHFPDTENALIQNAQIFWNDTQQIPHRASALRAWGFDKSHEIHLEGDARVWRQAPDEVTEFRGEQLIIEPQTGWVHSFIESTIQQANGTKIRADAFRYNRQNSFIEFEGHVQGTFFAKRP